MTLAYIVAKIGGDLYAGGRRALVPAPGHSHRDRSASLMINNSGRVIAYSFGGATPFDILDDLKERGLIDRNGFLSSRASCLLANPSRTSRQKQARAEDLWGEGGAINNTPSATYLTKHRGICLDLSLIQNLRHHDALPVQAYQPKKLTRPALMCRILGPDHKPTAIEITYLNAYSDRDKKLKLSRKIIGSVPAGSYVILDNAAETLVVGEGVMTSLSASEYFQLPAYALLGVNNMRAFRPPEHIKSVLIAADRGREGEAAAIELCATLSALGLNASVKLPPEQFQDFNDMAKSRLQTKLKKRGGQIRVTSR